MVRGWFAMFCVRWLSEGSGGGMFGIGWRCMARMFDIGWLAYGWGDLAFDIQRIVYGWGWRGLTSDGSLMAHMWLISDSRRMVSEYVVGRWLRLGGKCGSRR
jgi:hypothetical protein